MISIIMTSSCYDISYLTFNNNYSFTILQADIKPETDGCNGLKYNLTTDIIESIFRTYPMGQYLFLISFKADIIIEFFLDYFQWVCILQQISWNLFLEHIPSVSIYF